MSWDPVRALPVAPYVPQEDAHGLRDGWGPAEPVDVYGWAPTNPNAQPIDGDRRPVIYDREVYPAAMAGGPRARWEFPDGTFEQIGYALDYAEGPWWADGSAVVAYLQRVEG